MIKIRAEWPEGKENPEEVTSIPLEVAIRERFRKGIL